MGAAEEEMQKKKYLRSLCELTTKFRKCAFSFRYVYRLIGR
jgi:hypothetical protein